MSASNILEIKSHGSDESFTVTFRFQRNNTKLDNKALDDIERVVKYLTHQKEKESEVLLVGFANDGAPELNLNFQKSARKLSPTSLSKAEPSQRK
jgi:hypothetical protein